MSQDDADADIVEEINVVHRAQGERVLPLDDIDGQVELGGILVRLNEFDLKVARSEPQPLGPEHVEQDLEDRAAIETARRLQCLDEALERHILICVGAQ